jgi:hypothetical protein
LPLASLGQRTDADSAEYSPDSAFRIQPRFLAPKASVAERLGSWLSERRIRVEAWTSFFEMRGKILEILSLQSILIAGKESTRADGSLTCHMSNFEQQPFRRRLILPHTPSPKGGELIEGWGSSLSSQASWAWMLSRSPPWAEEIDAITPDGPFPKINF